MKFMMFVCTDSEPDTDRRDDIEDWVAFADARGRLDGDILAAPNAAVTLRMRGGTLLRTEGPFEATKEVIVGYDILECADLDAAIEIVRLHPMARLGRIELRPFGQIPA